MTPRIVIATVAIVCLVALAVAVRYGRPSELALTPAVPSSPIAAPADTYGDGFLPLLSEAAADAEALVAMGASRERNLLRIHAGQEAMTSSLASADAWLAAHPPPAADEAAIAAYRDGAAAIRTAMEEAQAGFLRFDFDRVARATETMREGEADLERAIALLKSRSAAEESWASAKFLSRLASQARQYARVELLTQRR